MTLVIMVWIMQVMMYMLMMFLMNNLVMMRSKRMMLMTMLQIAVSPEERMDWCGSWCWCLCRWWIIFWWCLDKDNVDLSHTMNNIVMMLICLTRRGESLEQTLPQTWRYFSPSEPSPDYCKELSFMMIMIMIMHTWCRWWYWWSSTACNDSILFVFLTAILERAMDRRKKNAKTVRPAINHRSHWRLNRPQR